VDGENSWRWIVDVRDWKKKPRKVSKSSGYCCYPCREKKKTMLVGM